MQSLIWIRHYLFVGIRLFPFIAVPMIWILVELTLYYRRKKSRAQFTCIVIGGFLSLLTILWLVFRGDVNADRWVNSLFF